MQGICKIGKTSEKRHASLIRKRSLVRAQAGTQTEPFYLRRMPANEVLEDGEWKHDFGQEEYDLFMPEASCGEFVAAQ